MVYFKGYIKDRDLEILIPLVQHPSQTFPLIHRLFLVCSIFSLKFDFSSILPFYWGKHTSGSLLLGQFLVSRHTFSPTFSKCNLDVKDHSVLFYHIALSIKTCHMLMAEHDRFVFLKKNGYVDGWAINIWHVFFCLFLIREIKSCHMLMAQLSTYDN